METYYSLYPGHIGSGWEHTGLMLCFREENFQFRGQMNPSKEELYDVLEDIYRDFWDMFGTMSLFHMGGDEVNLKCWNTSKELKAWMAEQKWSDDEDGFMKLWNYFQEEALKRFDKVTQTDPKDPVILWTSSLTEQPYLTKYLDKNRYIIQVWTKGDDPNIRELLENGYNLIISNYDSLYLDCGFGSWVSSGNNWCSPYIGWQKLYENRLDSIAGNYTNQIYGAEAALWSEQIDEKPMESRVWPRLSALAERLWSDPETGWQEAESRMSMHHKRLLEMGIKADRLQPEWCLQNEGQCPKK
jgi:hexosaminidase